MLEVSCLKCDHQGRLKITRLIELHGKAMKLPDLRTALAGDCPKAKGMDYERCDILFPQLRDLMGYRRLHLLLKREGVEINWKKLYRLYKEERLTVRDRRVQPGMPGDSRRQLDLRRTGCPGTGCNRGMPGLSLHGGLRQRH